MTSYRPSIITFCLSVEIAKHVIRQPWIITLSMKCKTFVNLKSDNTEQQNLTTGCVLKVPILAMIVLDNCSDHVAVVDCGQWMCQKSRRQALSICEFRWQCCEWKSGDGVGDWNTRGNGLEGLGNSVLVDGGSRMGNKAVCDIDHMAGIPTALRSCYSEHLQRKLRTRNYYQYYMDKQTAKMW